MPLPVFCSYRLHVVTPLIFVVFRVTMTSQAGMPIMYETQTTPSREHSKITCHAEYIKTLPGILKIVEIVGLSR